MRKRTLALISVLLVGFAMLGTGIALAASAPQPAPVADYCVTFGHGPTAAGNTVEFNWDHSQCPANSYPHAVQVNDSDPFIPPGFFLNSQSGNASAQHSGTAFTIIDQNSTGTVATYDCFFTVPTHPSNSTLTTDYTPGIECTKS